MTQDLTLRSLTQLPTAGRAKEPFGGPSAGAGMVMMMGRAVPSPGSSGATPLPCKASKLPVWTILERCMHTSPHMRNLTGKRLCLHFDGIYICLSSQWRR